MKTKEYTTPQCIGPSEGVIEGVGEEEKGRVRIHSVPFSWVFVKIYVESRRGREDGRQYESPVVVDDDVPNRWLRWCLLTVVVGKFVPCRRPSLPFHRSMLQCI